MSLTIKKSSFIFLIILSVIWYSVYLNIYPEKFKEIESNYPVIWKINSGLIRIWTYLTWKSTDISDKSKELYNETVTETKWKIDSVRKTLSWAEQTIDKAWQVIKKWQETLNEAGDVIVDIDRIWDWIMNSVNKDAMR